MPLINMVFKGGGGFVLNPGKNLFPWPPMSRVFAPVGAGRSLCAWLCPVISHREMLTGDVGKRGIISEVCVESAN